MTAKEMSNDELNNALAGVGAMVEGYAFVLQAANFNGLMVCQNEPGDLRKVLTYALEQARLCGDQDMITTIESLWVANEENAEGGQ